MKAENTKGIFALALLFIATAAFTQTNTWTGATDNDWHKACNWSLNLIPTCSHDVVIPNVTNDPRITATAHCRTIEIQSSSGALLEVVSSGGGILYASSTNGGACGGTATDNGGCCTTALWTQTSNPSSNSEEANEVVVDANYMYVIGEDAALGLGRQQWRIEKRDLSTGALVSGFGSGGVQLSDPMSTQPDEALGIAIDGSGIYICGYRANSLTNTEWRIEKRNFNTGALITSFGTSGVHTYNPTTGSEYSYDVVSNGTNIYVVGSETNGGTRWHMRCLNATSGALVWSQFSDPSTGADYAEGVAVDGSGVYIVGRDATPVNDQWRIEKRNLTTGALISGFGTGGVITNNFSSTKDYISDVAVDATGVYLLGYVAPTGIDYQWRIEKRNLTTGALISSFGTAGVVTVDPSTGYDAALGMSVYNGRVYVVGYDQTSGSTGWRTQIFNATSGASLCVTNPGTLGAHAVAANASGGFAVGWGTSGPFGGNVQWKMIEMCSCP